MGSPNNFVVDTQVGTDIIVPWAGTEVSLVGRYGSVPCILTIKATSWSFFAFSELVLMCSGHRCLVQAHVHLGSYHLFILSFFHPSFSLSLLSCKMILMLPSIRSIEKINYWIGGLTSLSFGMEKCLTCGSLTFKKPPSPKELKNK